MMNWKIICISDCKKKILPFLTEFFPNVQFVISTHSPFVLSSIDNAVIYDLEHQEPVTDLFHKKYSFTGRSRQIGRGKRQKGRNL